MSGDKSFDEPFEIRLSANALASYLKIERQEDADSLSEKIELLGLFPHLGHEYDPVYPAARPQFPVFVVYDGTYGIYYEISETRCVITVDYIVDQRRDPLDRFSAE